MVKKSLSIIIPAYNEAEAVGGVLVELRRVLNGDGRDFEIILVDDGSADRTAEIAKNVSGVKVIQHPYNRGYGAALKTGIREASFDWVLLYDADGQFAAGEIGKLTKIADDDQYDMAVGVRINSTTPFIRRPGRAVLHFLANYLSDQKIPDLNSGFRIIRKEKLFSFWHLLPDSFSFSTTSTLAFQKAGLAIAFVPIQTHRRISGKSSVRPRHALKMFLLILRTILMFSPLRIFLPVAGLLGVLALGSFVYDLIQVNINDTTVLLFVSSLLVFFFGLIADQLAALRQELRSNEKGNSRFN